MKYSESWQNRLSDRLSLTGEPFPGLPIVELAGNCRMLIEQHQGIIEYGENRIRICMSFGEMCVEGCGLSLLSMSRFQLIIGGEIEKISLNRRI